MDRIPSVDIEPVQQLAFQHQAGKLRTATKTGFEKNHQIVDFLKFQILSHNDGFKILFRCLLKMEVNLSIEMTILGDRCGKPLILVGLLKPFLDELRISHKGQGLLSEWP
jgi:hypothetical protein